MREVAGLKLCLISFGLLLGLYFADFFAEYLWLWWAIFIVTTLYFITRLLNEK